MSVVIIIIIVFLVYVFITYNRLVKLKLAVQQAKSGIDVYLQQRFDLIPNLVECVKQYAKYENEVYTNLAKLRANYNQNKDLETGKKLNSNLNNFIATAESYPELKADEHFLMLQKSLAKMENQLQAARRLYNIEVTSLNKLITTFPSNLIANSFNFQMENLFELENEEAMQNIKIDINTEEKK